MQIYLSIDDTDNLESPGSGQLAEILSNELLENNLATKCSNITRHQLFIHEDVPFTSHNSAMCFSASLEGRHLNDVILYSKRFLQKSSASGSDPGLCVMVENDGMDYQQLTEFGMRAKNKVLTKTEAYNLAGKTGVHLSEHGGTGDGVIGALAGVGLRLDGNDGRFRGWLNFGKAGELVSCAEFCSHEMVEAVVDQTGTAIPEDASVLLVENRTKTVCLNHRQVIVVKATYSDIKPFWKTLTKKEIKRF